MRLSWEDGLIFENGFIISNQTKTDKRLYTLVDNETASTMDAVEIFTALENIVPKILLGKLLLKILVKVFTKNLRENFIIKDQMKIFDPKWIRDNDCDLWEIRSHCRLSMS